MKSGRIDFLIWAGLFAAVAGVGTAGATALPVGRESDAPFAPLTLSAGNFDPVGGHIQGLCCSDAAIYLTQMKWLYKFDWSGRLLKKRDVISHTGDICFWKGEVYASVAVYGGPNVGKGMIQVFDADLNPVRETLLDRTTDGITVLDGVLYLGMGAKTQPSRTPHRENIVGRFDPVSLKPIAERQAIDYGHKTKYGAQDVSTDGRHIYFAFYAGEKDGPDFVQFDRDLKPLRAIVCWAANGFDLLPPRFGNGTPRFLRARTLFSLPDADGRRKVVGCALDTFEAPER